MGKVEFLSPSAIIADFKTLIRKALLLLSIEKKYPNQPFSMLDRKKLESAKRYTKMQIIFFGKPFYIADAMTFLSGFKDIFKKEPYRFKFDFNYPFIIDCGANIGLSVVYFKMKYPEAKVIAIEPDPELFLLLKKNLESFGYNDVMIFQKAVWYKDGMLDFIQEGGFSGQISQNKAVDKIISVESIAFDRLIKDLNIGFIKMDIEGSENEVFNHSSLNLNNVQNIFIEYHSRIGENQYLHTLLSKLSEQGFRYHIHHEFISLSPLTNRSELVGMDLQLSVFGFK